MKNVQLLSFKLPYLLSILEVYFDDNKGVFQQYLSEYILINILHALEQIKWASYFSMH